MSITIRQEQIVKNLQEFPALAIELTPQQIKQSASSSAIITFTGLTQHQKQACRIAAARLNWHPQYIAETSPTDRPALFRSLEDLNWREKAQNWQKEHELSTEDLATQYAEYFEKVGYRLCEPISWREGVRISAHDESLGKYPCPIAEW